MVDFNRVPGFYHNYIKQVHEDNLEQAFKKHETALPEELKQIPPAKWDYSYAQGKWTIKQLVQHLIDAERIFCYRALRFARKDATELPGFDENLYAASCKAEKRTKDELMEELGIVQRSSRLLFGAFDEEQMEQQGIANGNIIYVRAIGFIIIGHALHHRKILLERYLGKPVPMPLGFKIVL